MHGHAVPHLLSCAVQLAATSFGIVSTRSPLIRNGRFKSWGAFRPLPSRTRTSTQAWPTGQQHLTPPSIYMNLTKQFVTQPSDNIQYWTGAQHAMRVLCCAPSAIVHQVVMVHEGPRKWAFQGTRCSCWGLPPSSGWAATSQEAACFTGARVASAPASSAQAGTRFPPAHSIQPAFAVLPSPSTNHLPQHSIRGQPSRSKLSSLIPASQVTRSRPSLTRAG